VVTAVLQIKYLNKALQRFDSTEVIPTQFVLFTVSAIIGSAVLYHDFDGMDMEQMSRFMSGCAIEFLGVYLITSKRTKKHINSPALSISADSGTAISFSDEEALDRVDLLPSDRLHPHPTHTSNRKRNSVLNSTGAILNGRSTQPINTPSFEAWQEANPHINISNNSMNSNRRRSSVFRGISMASQLLDRNDENQQQQAIQLPISSSPNNNYHRTNRIVPEPSSSTTSAIGNIISGITSAITSHTHHDPAAAVEEADAVEIEIPTPSSFHHSENLLDRELMPINNMNNKRSTKLVDIEENSSEEYRDLS
jgi:hypothetical protein